MGRTADFNEAMNNGAASQWAFRNKLINGAFEIWQRGTSFVTPANLAYTADRWQVTYDGSIGSFTIDRQNVTPGTIAGDPRYLLRWAQSVAGSGSTFRILQQRIESVRTNAGRKKTVRFYAKGGASLTLGVSLSLNFGTGGSPSAAVSVATQNVSVTTGGGFHEVTFDVPSISGKTIGSNNDDCLIVQFRMPLNATFTLDLGMAQGEEGQFATPFEWRPTAVELAMCQRYYEKSFDISTAPASNIGNNTGESRFIAGKAGANPNYSPSITFSNRKRKAPTVTLFNPQAANAQVRDFNAAADCSATATAVNEGSFAIQTTGNASTAVGNLLFIHWAADAEL